MHDDAGDMVGVEIRAPQAAALHLLADGELLPMDADAGTWRGWVREGTGYGVVVDSGDGISERPLVDPRAMEVWFPPGHRRDAARVGASVRADAAPRAVARRWPAPCPPRRTSRPLVVAEAHVRGLTMRRARPDAGTFVALRDELPRLAELGVSVVELLPVQQFDPDEDNYWGYMPMVFGAVHRDYAAGDDAPAELADLVAHAHDVDIEIWLDVVFNHTTEEGSAGPTYNLRALGAADYYVVDGGDVNASGTGNTIDARSAAVQSLVVEALDRFADLGVDGFRFDLATILSRDRDFVRHLGSWAERRGVRLVAEPWDLARYELGQAFPDPRWMQWNDRFRDDLRSFLRGEPGLVPAVMQRVGGSPDLFDRPDRSVNFLTAHDGFTLYDLVAYNHKHNEANGHDGRDGTDDNRSWNCGWEGDRDLPEDVRQLRGRQMRNAMTLLLMSAGVPMFVAGDEFARTQHGNNNPYNQDNEISWVDWNRREDFVGLERFVADLIGLRASCPALAGGAPWADEVTWLGADGPPDLAHHSRSIGWALPELVVLANMWWEPLTFGRLPAGNWHTVVDTAAGSGFVEPNLAGPEVVVAPRSVVVLASAP